MEISNFILFFLFIKTYLIYIYTFYPTSTITTKCNIFFSSPLKQKTTKLFTIIRSSLCGNLMLKVERSKFEVEFTFLRLLSLFIAPTTDLFIVLFYPKSVDTSKNHTFIIIWLHLSRKKWCWRFRRRYYESSFIEVFIRHKHPVHVTQSTIFNRNIANTKFSFQIYHIFYR